MENLAVGSSGTPVGAVAFGLSYDVAPVTEL
eukprot:CAMPEP_0182843436 /NCGR_PEP_ID=MMETSP0006_2-20121128/26186_1 /TAXON_ID=97485 /ORGANISM="Prymnesium parvum, Strain Texoma1" /LENGTH=30 /DNA_ID= /DNA_START= /DNA_END= /DNA_ORIENTATION=